MKSGLHVGTRGHPGKRLEAKNTIERTNVKASRKLALLIWLTVAVDGIAQVERRADLGDGYDAAVIAKPSRAPFESIGNWEYLRYKGKELCLIGGYALSPDKRFIAFQESNTGKIFLMDKQEHRRVELVAEFPGLVRSFDWKTKSGFLKIEIEGKEALVLPLLAIEKNKK
ncbi:MAG: hypothetical protein ABI222_05000 [Opitutaceae bacterium]